MISSKTEHKSERLPSTIGKFPKNATNAGGAAFSISSTVWVDLSFPIATVVLEKVLEAAIPGAMVLGGIAGPTVKHFHALSSEERRMLK